MLIIIIEKLTIIPRGSLIAFNTLTQIKCTITMDSNYYCSLNGRFRTVIAKPKRKRGKNDNK